MWSNLILSQNMIFKKFSAPSSAVLSEGGRGMGKKTRRDGGEGGWKSTQPIVAITHSSTHWTVDYLVGSALGKVTCTSSL